MNAVEIEAAISDLALEPFDTAKFPFAFLAAFGNKALRGSPATAKAKAKFILAPDGQTLEAEALGGGETITCTYHDFPNPFGFFLPLAGSPPSRRSRKPH